jgi:hypothetical protein
MARVTGFWSLAGLVVIGLIVADVWTHPSGTNAAGSQIVNLEKNTGSQLTGH